VLATDLDQSLLDQLIADLPGQGHRGVALDLKSFDDQQSLIDCAVNEMDGLYALAHTAALLRRRQSVDDVSEDDWDAQIDTNLKATFFLSRRAANAMKENGGGRIILFTSQSWMTGGFGEQQSTPRPRVASCRWREDSRAPTGNTASRSIRWPRAK
jgi:NAD(P)-dependent dehydrogenase (short-subunit alcohol dehydrogenase family)